MPSINTEVLNGQGGIVDEHPFDDELFWLLLGLLCVVYELLSQDVD